MLLNANIRQRIRKDSFVHVKRSLHGKGKLTCTRGQEVQPEDMLGNSVVSAGFSAVNLARKLGISKEDGLKYLQRPVGSKIFKGELLASKKGFFKQKIITAPTDGLIDQYDASTGELRLRFLPKEVPLTAGVYGIVDDVNPVTGEVLIKTMVTEIFGMLGSGKERGGLLHVINEPGQLVEPSKITPGMHQKIIVAGGLIYGEVLKRAAGYGVNGVICGGLNSKDFISIAGSIDPVKRIGSEVGMSVLATEGFGTIPIGTDIYSVLKNFHDKFVFLNGNTNMIILPQTSPDSILTLRKVALPVSKSPRLKPDLNVGEVSIGVKVRVIWPPFMGVQGTVAGIDQTPTQLPSGITTYLVVVETSLQKIKVPFSNIEIIT